MDESHLKFHPSDRQVFYWAISTVCFLIVYLSMILWGAVLKDYVDQELMESTSLNLTILFFSTCILTLRDGLPLVISVLRQIHYEIFIWPSELEAKSKAELERYRQEIMQPPVPKAPRKAKLKPVGEPINLRQWIGQRSYSGKGYVYILKDIEISGYYKIGKTSQPYERMKTFGVRLPFAAELVHVIECDNADRLEIKLHYQFADKRKQGEWFALTDEDIKSLKLLNQVQMNGHNGE